MLTTDRLKQGGYLFVALLENIFVVEPNTLLIGETGTGLRTLGDIKERYEFIKRK